MELNSIQFKQNVVQDRSRCRVRVSVAGSEVSP
jgi:hypothetical protein